VPLCHQVHVLAAELALRFATRIELHLTMQSIN
jgi:hypothetical protein